MHLRLEPFGSYKSVAHSGEYDNCPKCNQGCGKCGEFWGHYKDKDRNGDCFRPVKLENVYYCPRCEMTF